MRVFVLLIAILYAFPVNGQMCPCEFGSSGKIRRHELGLNVISSIGEPGKYRVYDAAVIGTILNGINYKYHKDKYSFRASAAYKHYNIDDTLDFGNPILKEWTVGKAAFYEFRTGIEKTIVPGKWRVYAGLDLLYGYGKASGNQYQRNVVQSEYDVTINYFGVSIVPGLNFRPKETWSFNLEPCVNFTSNHQNGNIGNKVFNRSYFLLNTLSFNLHF